METTQRNLSLQVQFWALLGPLIALMTMVVIFVKASPQAFYLSFATISGVLASWKWKEKGFLASCIAILCLYGYQYSDMHPTERLWNLGISFSIALGFGITALTYQEVDSLITTSEDEESVDPFKEAFAREQQRVLHAEQEIAAKQVQIESYHQLVDTARQEVSKISLQHQKLLKDFLDKQLEWSQLQEKLSQSISQEEFQQLHNQLSAAQERIHILSEQQSLSLTLEGNVIKKEEEITHLRAQVQEMEHELARASEEMANQLHMEKLESKQAIHELQVQIQNIEIHLLQKEQELTQKQILLAQKEAEVADLQKGLEADLLQKDQELTQKQNLLAQKEAEVADLQKTMEADLLQKDQELTQKQNLLAQKEVEIADLQKTMDEVFLKKDQELTQKQSLLAQKEAEVADLQKALESPPVIHVEEVATGEMRRLEGLLKQLRIQFEEKSQTLDMARKELFRTQEKLLSLEKECEERGVYDIDANEQSYQKYIQQLLGEVNMLQEEVQHLESLVASLTS